MNNFLKSSNWVINTCMFHFQVEPVPLTEINFEKPKRIPKPEKKLVYNRPRQRELKIENPTELLQELRLSSPNAVIFTVTDPKPPVLKDPKLPVNLTKLYDVRNCDLEQNQLVKTCENTFQGLTVTAEQAKNLEKATKSQSKSGLWHEYRAGRLTTSLFYDIIHTNIDSPSVSLLKKVMNYETSFSCAATTWGLANEENALREYFNQVSHTHSNFSLSNSGFVINTAYPHLGSTPDGIVKCDCCGEGTVEVKCPYRFKDVHPCDIDIKSFFLQKHMEAHSVCKNALRKEHKYFYQIQGQMGICAYKYCDFICFTNAGIHVERVLFDQEFFNELESKLTRFFKKCIMPEVLTQSLKHGSSKLSKRDVICFCGQDNRQGAMVTCDSDHCVTKVFHMKCVGLKVAPKTKWYCLTCRPAKRQKQNS